MVTATMDRRTSAEPRLDGRRSRCEEKERFGWTYELPRKFH